MLYPFNIETKKLLLNIFNRETLAMPHQTNKLLIFLLLLLPTKLIIAKNNQCNNNNNISFGIIPVFSYDADLGLKYGAVINLFDSKINEYPNYDQYLNLKLSHTTRNTLNLQALFESIKLIPQATSFLEVTYTNDQKLDFLGFNGIETIINNQLSDSNNDNFIDKQFYNINRKLIRLRADVQKNIIGEKLRLLTGFSYYNVMVKLPMLQNDSKSLYENYIEWGLINRHETTGGKSALATIGFIYDTRNNNTFCTKGTWIEGFVKYAPKLGNSQSFSKLVLTYRAYKSIKNEKYTFSMRLSSQNKLSGNIPSYMLPFYFDTQINEDGLGGAYTLRGITRNRIVADGFALGNFESRIQLKEFRLLNLDFLISSTLFADVAFITQRRQTDLSNVPLAAQNEFFSNASQTLNVSFGPGINITFNKNNITTVNYGFSPNAQLGNGGLYIGSKFLF